MNPLIKERVDAFCADLDASPVARHVLGVVVSGSAARGEEIWHGDVLTSDIDLMVLTRRTDPRLIAGIERVIAPHRDRGIDGGQIPLGPLAHYLTLAFYEARVNGVVVQGDIDLRRLVPPIEAVDLPIWEGVRVLANRLVEHVKADEGLISPERATAKSYEALTEAYLVGEGRYRPSYAERLAELDHAPPDAPDAMVAGMRAVLKARLEGAEQRALPGLAQARAHLIAGLGLLTARYGGAPGPAATGLARLARSERHWRHRLYWAAAMLRERRLGAVDLTVDPVLRIWQRALVYVTTGATSTQRRLLLRDWRACPQLLVRRGIS